MALIPGRLGRVRVSDDGGTSFLLVGCVVDASLAANADELDATCHETGQFRQFLQGHKDGSIDMTLHWDEADGGQAIIRDTYESSTTLVVNYRMQDGTGFLEYESEAIVTNFSLSSGLEDVADIDVTLRLNGDFSSSAQP